MELFDFGRGALDGKRWRQRRRFYARRDRVDRERSRSRDRELVVIVIVVIVVIVVGTGRKDFGTRTLACDVAELEVVILVAAPLLGRAARRAQLGRELRRRHQEPVAMRAPHQRFLEFAGGLVARVGIDRERLLHDRVEVGGQPRRLACDLRDRLRVDLVGGRGQASRDEQPLAGQDLVHAHRDRIEITAVIERLALRLFGRHVADLAFHLVE